MLEKEVKVSERPNVKIYYIIALTWIVAAFAVPMISIFSFILLALVSVGEWVILQKVLPSDKTYTEIIHKPDTGNMELDDVLTLGSEYIDSIRKANAAIKDEELSGQISNIENVSKQILETIEKKPDELNKIRKFMSYYLPTTIKLLNAYGEYESASVKTENIEKSMASIKKSVGMINGSFDKLLNSLYENDMIDIQTDIDVYEKMTSIDGYKEFK